MAQVVLKIKANDGADILATFTADKIVNNVSTLIGQETTKNNGVNGKTFATGFLSLYDGFLGGKDTKLQSEIEKYNGFMFGATDETGAYSLKLTLTGNNLDKIVIIGDVEANQYPVRAILDEGTEYEKIVYSNNSNWAIAFNNESTTHTIHFIKWNRANYNACFTTLKVMAEYLEMDKGWVDSVESLTQSTSDPSSIQYGVLANSGSANIRDLNGELREYVEDGVLENSNVPVELFVNGNKIQEHITTDGSTYKDDDKMLNLQLTNDIQYLETQKDGFILLGDKTAYGVLERILWRMGYDDLTPIEDQVILDNDIYTTTENNGNSIRSIKDYLNDITLDNPFMYSQSAKEMLNKFCELTQLNCFKNKDNKLEFISARPKYFFYRKNIISINPYQILSSSSGNFDLFVKNKYTKINKTEVNHIKTIKDTINVNWQITDSDNNIQPNLISSNAEIVESGDDKILQFFYEFNGSDNTINSLYSGSNPYTAEISFSSGDTIDTVKSISILSANNDINDFSFQDKTRRIYNLKKHQSFNHFVFAIKCLIPNSIISLNKPINLQIVIRTHNINVTKANNDSNTENNTYEIDGNNELIYETVKYQNEKMVDIISNNILSDYANGLKTLSLDVFCVDFYNILGDKIKDFSKGEIFYIGEVVKICDKYGNSKYKRKDGSDIYWKIVGVNYNYNGSHTISLTLQEIINIYYA